MYLFFAFIHCREPSEGQSGGTHCLWIFMISPSSVFSLPLTADLFRPFAFFSFFLLVLHLTSSASPSPPLVPSLVPLSLSLLSSNWNWQLWRSWHTPVTGSWLERNYKRERKREYGRTERERDWTLDVVLFRDGRGLPGMNVSLYVMLWHISEYMSILQHNRCQPFQLLTP